MQLDELTKRIRISVPYIPAPSIEPKNFCDVQSPASVKLGIGVR